MCFIHFLNIEFTCKEMEVIESVVVLKASSSGAQLLRPSFGSCQNVEVLVNEVCLS